MYTSLYQDILKQSYQCIILRSELRQFHANPSSEVPQIFHFYESTVELRLVKLLLNAFEALNHENEVYFSN